MSGNVPERFRNISEHSRTFPEISGNVLVMFWNCFRNVNADEKQKKQHIKHTVHIETDQHLLNKTTEKHNTIDLNDTINNSLQAKQIEQ